MSQREPLYLSRIRNMLGGIPPDLQNNQKGLNPDNPYLQNKRKGLGSRTTATTNAIFLP